jgi:hypothetical protein
MVWPGVPQLKVVPHCWRATGNSDRRREPVHAIIAVWDAPRRPRMSGNVGCVPPEVARPLGRRRAVRRYLRKQDGDRAGGRRDVRRRSGAADPAVAPLHVSRIDGSDVDRAFPTRRVLLSEQVLDGIGPRPPQAPTQDRCRVDGESHQKAATRQRLTAFLSEAVGQLRSRAQAKLAVDASARCLRCRQF